MSMSVQSSLTLPAVLFRLPVAEVNVSSISWYTGSPAARVMTWPLAVSQRSVKQPVGDSKETSASPAACHS